MKEIILMVVLMIGMNLTFKNKYAMLSTTIIFNNLLNFIFVFTLYLSYFNNKISGTTFICSIVTLMIIYILLFTYKHVKKQYVTIIGYVFSVVPLLVVLYFESPLLKYENKDYSISFYHPTEVLNDTNISILAVGTMKLNESEQVNLDNQIILNQVEITNIERYLSNNRGLFFDYFGGNSFRESLINVEHLIGRKTKSIEQMAIKQNVNGDSAGLAMTLSSMIELDLVSNNIPIAITGSIDIEGNVKAVGAVSEKVQIAVMDGFKYLIVPTANYDEAKETLEKLNEKLSIIPVRSVTEAKIAIEEINYQ